jgi:hypothetical protein
MIFLLWFSRLCRHLLIDGQQALGPSQHCCSVEGLQDTSIAAQTMAACASASHQAIAMQFLRPRLLLLYTGLHTRPSQDNTQHDASLQQGGTAGSLNPTATLLLLSLAAAKQLAFKAAHQNSPAA